MGLRDFATIARGDFLQKASSLNGAATSLADAANARELPFNYSQTCYFVCPMRPARPRRPAARHLSSPMRPHSSSPGYALLSETSAKAPASAPRCSTVAHGSTLSSTLRMCSFLNSVAVVVTFIISNDADVFTPESLCLILTQKVTFCVWARPRRGGGWGGGSEGLELESQSDEGKLKSNVQQFDFEPHESTLGTITSVKFICAASTVSFWI